MNRNRTIGVAVLAAALATSANAALTSEDWQNPGDGLLTVDSDTGLQWLDWSYTANRSYNDVFSQLGSGGEFEGFRYATESEIRTLYANAGAVSIAPIDGTDAGNIPALNLLSSLLGDTFSTGSEAIYDLAGNASEQASSLGDWPFSGPAHHMVTAFNYSSGQIAVRWLNLEDTTPADFIGSALVLIPAPGTAALGAFGALLMVRRRR